MEADNAVKMEPTIVEAVIAKKEVDPALKDEEENISERFNTAENEKEELSDVIINSVTSKSSSDMEDKLPSSSNIDICAGSSIAVCSSAAKDKIQQQPTLSSIPSVKVEGCNGNFDKIVTQNDNRIGVKNFKCSVCEKSFRRRRDLIKHVKKHSEVDFKCSVCGKCFSDYRSFNVHMKVHSGVKDFKCYVCRKSFSRFKYLTKHNERHANVDGFKCSVCGKCFSQYRNLCDHMKVHIEVIDSNCSVCRKPFRRCRNLVKHIAIHTGVKDF